jgi:hypothetical protein
MSTQETESDASPSLLMCGKRPLESLTPFAFISQVTALHYAAWAGYSGTCQLLISLKADVNARDSE